jgi:hypothetical protein
MENITDIVIESEAIRVEEVCRRFKQGNIKHHIYAHEKAKEAKELLHDLLCLSLH